MPIKLYFRTLKFEFYIIFALSGNITLLLIFQPLKIIKNILISYNKQNQVMSQTWPTGHSLLMLFVDCGYLNKKYEHYLINKVLRIFEEGHDVCKSVF